MVDFKTWTYYRELIDIAENLLDELGVPYEQEYIEFSTTKKKSYWGLCRWTKNSFGDYDFTIEVSEELIETHNDHAIIETIIHELLHTIAPKDKHGGKWKKYAEYVNSHSDYHITRASSATERGIEMKYKYKCICDKCGETGYYQRKTKGIENHFEGYTCSKCHGKSFSVYDSEGNKI